MTSSLSLLEEINYSWRISAWVPSWQKVDLETAMNQHQWANRVFSQTFQTKHVPKWARKVVSASQCVASSVGESPLSCFYLLSLKKKKELVPHISHLSPTCQWIFSFNIKFYLESHYLPAFHLRTLLSQGCLSRRLTTSLLKLTEHAAYSTLPKAPLQPQ